MESTSSLSEISQRLRRLHGCLRTLEEEARQCDVPPLAGREWYELLVRKLLPQTSGDAYLVAAVVGGTNIGKSVVFNHIAGLRASSTSPLASGTKHPTCLLPEGFDESHTLADVFPGFTLVPWSDADEALRATDDHLLFWKPSDSIPENLLVLDTPDIDSDAKINWERADHIRQCADVLVAVLTQQKYNDAAVKEFFRKAAQEDKAILIVFNQCELPDDEEYWPLWVGTFCEETGVDPEIVYVAPNDRGAAEENRLPFYERDLSFLKDSSLRNTDCATMNQEPRDLLQDLSELRFGEIKVRALHGSLERLTDEVPRYLNEVVRRSDDYRLAAEELTTHKLAEVDTWPPLPNPLLVAEIRRWWQVHRTGWQASVHNFYNRLGAGIVWPVKYVREQFGEEQVPAFEAYRQQEWKAGVLKTVGAVYDRLTTLSRLGNELLRPRLEELLAGTSRQELLRRIEKAHQEYDLQAELAEMVEQELASFETDNPQSYEFFKKLDTFAAAVRPATSVVLILSGAGPVGELAGPLFGNAAMSTVAHVAGDAVGGTVTAAVGDAAVSRGAASGVGYLQAQFRRLHQKFVARRAAWLGELLQEHLLGTLPDDLITAAGVSGVPAIAEVRALVEELKTEMDTQSSVEAQGLQPLGLKRPAGN